MKSARKYIEDGAEEHYIAVNRRFFLKPFEERAEYLGILREKARYRLSKPDGQTSRFAREAMDCYLAETDDQISAAIGDDLESFRAFQQRVTDRIVSEFKSGRLAVLRCPACNRVAFTPETRQCVWCGHDWHSV